MITREDVSAQLAECRCELAKGARDLLSALERDYIPTANEARIIAEAILEYTTATDIATRTNRTTKLHGCTLYVHDTDPSWTPCVHAVEYTIEGAGGCKDVRATQHLIWGAETVETIVAWYAARYEPHMLTVFNASQRAQ